MSAKTFSLTAALLMCFVLLACRFMDAQGMLTAISAALVVTSASLWAAESNPSINNIRRQNNKEFVALVMLAGCILIYLLGCAMLLVTAVILPLTRKFKKTFLTLG